MDYIFFFFKSEAKLLSGRAALKFNKTSYGFVWRVIITRSCWITDTIYKELTMLLGIHVKTNLAFL